jgi:MFS family permease
LAGAGYFVDIFDLLLFAVLRVPSLRELGAGDRLLEAGTTIQNAQLVGMMLGGLLWGSLGDRQGRRAALHGSILLYSLATLGSATATRVTQYAVWRFVAGFGLAGELGAALTIVSERVDPRERGAATTIVATLGVMGAVAAALAGEWLPWRAAYVTGGVMGLVLLGLRVRLPESAMFARVRESDAPRGDVTRFFRDRGLALRYVRAILIGTPVWFTTGVLITFAPEFAQALGVEGAVSAGRAVLVYYAATTLGDLASGLLSQRLKSRRKAVAVFHGFCVVGIAAYVGGVARTPAQFYAVCAWLGFAAGFWAVMVTMAVEQFGTDLRATAATSVPTFVRATAVPMAVAFVGMKAGLGVGGAGAVVGAVVIVVAVAALAWQGETYGRTLVYVEG